MNSESEAWKQLEDHAADRLHPDAASRALASVVAIRRRQKMAPFLAAGLSLLLGVGICASSWVQAYQQQTANLKLWEHTVAANIEVTRSL